QRLYERRDHEDQEDRQWQAEEHCQEGDVVEGQLAPPEAGRLAPPRLGCGDRGRLKPRSTADGGIAHLISLFSMELSLRILSTSPCSCFVISATVILPSRNEFQIGS